MLIWSLHCHRVSGNDGVTIEEVTEVTDELVLAWQKLLPQLSSGAKPIDATWLKRSLLPIA